MDVASIIYTGRRRIILTDTDSSSDSSWDSTSSDDLDIYKIRQLRLDLLKQKAEKEKEEQQLKQDLSRPPATPIILKVGETQQLDVYSDEWWFTATVDRVNDNYLHIQFNQWDNDWDRWAYLPNDTDFLIFNKLYKTAYPPLPSTPSETKDNQSEPNDYNDSPPPPPSLPMDTYGFDGKSVKFAPLNTYTVAYETLNNSPFVIQTKPMYYYSKHQAKSYLITVTNDDIHKYDIQDNKWSLMVRPPIYLNKHRVCMDQINGKLYLFSKDTFGIFDIETLKWNAIQRIEHQSVCTDTNGIDRSSITGWGQNNYKTEIESVICIHDADNTNDIDDSESKEAAKNDGIQWFDEQLNIWRDGLILNENKGKGTIKIKYCIIDDAVRIGMNKFENLNDIKIKREPRNYMIDNDLEEKMRKLRFYAIQRKDRFTESLIFKWSGGKLMRLIPKHRVCNRVISGSKLLFVKSKQMLMLFGGRNGAQRIKWRITEYRDIWYKILDNNQWIEHKKRLPKGWSDGHQNEYTDIILIRDRILIFFCFDFGEIYCWDLINRNWIKHYKTFDIPFKCPIMAIYDNKNDFIHLLSKSGYNIKHHLKIKIYQLIPTQMFRMEMIIGFLRISEIEHNLIIPYSLYDIIVMYYPKYDDIKPYPDI